MQKTIVGILIAGVLIIVGARLFKADPSPTKTISLAPPQQARVTEPPIPTPPIPVQNEHPSQTIPKTEEKPQPIDPHPCLNDTARFQCLQALYKKIVKDTGVGAAMSALKNQDQSDTYVKAMCHQLAHVVGRAAIDRYPTAEDAFSHGDSFCWSGYYHGAMEAIVTKLGETKVTATMNQICSKIPGKERYSFDYYNCVHGLGHGFMSIKKNELFDSLKLCDNLTGGWEQSSCWGGVFMENIIADEMNHFAKYLKPEEPLYPCSAVDEKYKQTCYLMQTSYMLRVLNSDFAKVFELCSTTGNHVNTCYQSLGRDASGRTSSTIPQTKAYCLIGKDYAQQSNCIIGAVKDFISFYHSDVQAKQFCAALPEELQQVCTSTATDYYRIL